MNEAKKVFSVRLKPTTIKGLKARVQESPEKTISSVIQKILDTNLETEFHHPNKLIVKANPLPTATLANIIELVTEHFGKITNIQGDFDPNKPGAVVIILESSSSSQSNSN